MNRTTCVEALEVPQADDGKVLADGSIRDVGVYFRNQEDARPRFGDSEYGHTLDPQPYKWRWVEDDVFGLSVNLESCVRCPECSVLLHPNPGRYGYVVRIALVELSAALELKLVAKYAPIRQPPEAENLCHFDILPMDDSLDDVVVNIKSALKKLYAALEKKPTNDQAKEAARSAAKRIESLLQVIPVRREAA